MQWELGNAGAERGTFTREEFAWCPVRDDSGRYYWLERVEVTRRRYSRGGEAFVQKINGHPASAGEDVSLGWKGAAWLAIIAGPITIALIIALLTFL